MANCSAAGNDKAAVCSDCHGEHEVLAPNDPTSPVFRANVPKTCSKCHSDEAAQFAKSIHGKVLADGNTEGPVCTTCHGVHTIKAVKDKDSWVSPRNQGRHCLRPVPQQRENDGGVRHSRTAFGQL